MIAATHTFEVTLTTWRDRACITKFSPICDDSLCVCQQISKSIISAHTPSPPSQTHRRVQLRFQKKKKKKKKKNILVSYPLETGVRHLWLNNKGYNKYFQAAITNKWGRKTYSCVADSPAKLPGTPWYQQLCAFLQIKDSAGAVP